MENNMPSAEDYFMNHTDIVTMAGNKHRVIKALIEFAKLHVEAALQAASEKSKLEKAYDYGNFNKETAKWMKSDDTLFYKESYGHGDCGYEARRIDKDSILTAYSTDNIK